MTGNGQVHGSAPAGKKVYAAPRKRGHSKNGRSDAPQIVVGLAVTRDGFPVRHWVFPGNTVDVTTVAKVKEDLKGWQLTRCLFVGDAGMVSQANSQALAKGGGKYLLACRCARGDEVTESVLTRPGRYRKVARESGGQGSHRRRGRAAAALRGLLQPPGSRSARRRIARQLLEELEAELASSPSKAEAHSKRVCALRARPLWPLAEETPTTGLAIDRRGHRRTGEASTASSSCTATTIA